MPFVVFSSRHVTYIVEAICGRFGNYAFVFFFFETLLERFSDSDASVAWQSLKRMASSVPRETGLVVFEICIGEYEIGFPIIKMSCPKL